MPTAAVIMLRCYVHGICDVTRAVGVGNNNSSNYLILVTHFEAKLKVIFAYLQI